MKGVYNMKSFTKNLWCSLCVFLLSLLFNSLIYVLYAITYVPYYDKEGNKYLYSFDANEQKGYYTNLSTQEIYENEYSFVDEDGYLVYDEEHNFERQENIENVRTYKDSSGKTYYWASNISWDKDGNLLDIYGKTIK